MNKETFRDIWKKKIQTSYSITYGDCEKVWNHQQNKLDKKDKRILELEKENKELTNLKGLLDKLIPIWKKIGVKKISIDNRGVGSCVVNMYIPTLSSTPIVAWAEHDNLILAAIKATGKASKRLREYKRGECENL